MHAVVQIQAESVMDSVKRIQVGVSLQYPRIGALSLWERARVRGFYF
jgi:hypothetical protein